MKLTLRLSTLVLLLALASALTWLLGRPSRDDLQPASYPGQSTSVVAAPLPDGPLSQDESENIEIYRRVSPGVVNITSTTLGFDFFFSAFPQQGSGSGTVIDAQGHILDQLPRDRRGSTPGSDAADRRAQVRSPSDWRGPAQRPGHHQDRSRRCAAYRRPVGGFGRSQGGAEGAGHREPLRPAGDPDGGGDQLPAAVDPGPERPADR